MARNNSVYFHADAAAPFLVTRLLTLSLSVAFSSGLIWGYGRIIHRELSELGYFLILILVVSILEYSADSLKIRSVPLLVHFYWSLSWVARTLRLSATRSRFKFARGLFYMLSTAVLILIVWHAKTGWNEPTASPETQRDLVVAGLTLAVGIVAIFFTVLGLVLQRTMEDYSPSFVTPMVNSGVYIFFFILSLAVAILDLWILVRGVNSNLVAASVSGSFYCVISVPFLVIETFQNLDMSNVIRRIARTTIRTAQRKIKEQPPILTADPAKSSSPQFPFHTALTLLIEKWISGTMHPRSGLPQFDVPDEVIATLQERVRSITNTTLKAITLDQREVVLTCLAAMSQIVDGYVRARSSYEGKTDSFLLFMSDQIQIIFNASLRSPNEQYTSDAASSVADFAASTLRLTLSIQGRYPENSHVGIFCGVLQTIAIRAFQLQHSDASPKCCDYLGRVGNRLIAQEAYEPVLFGIADRLEGVGLFVSSQMGAWPSLVCQTCLSQLNSLLHASLQQAVKSEHHYNLASKMLLEKIQAIVVSWYQSDHSHLDNQTITAPLVGGLWTGTKWTKIVATTLRSPLTERTKLPILHDVSNIVRTLTTLACIAIQKARTPQFEYFVALSEVAYEAITFAGKSANDERISDEGFNLVDKCFRAAIRLLNASCSTPSYQGYEDLFHLSSMWAFLISAYERSKSPRLLDIYTQATDQLISVIEKSLAKGPERHPEFSEPYKYIKLFGAWLYRYCPKHPLNKKILLFLGKNHRLQELGLRHSSYSPMADIGYPTELIGQAWYIHPSQHWPDEQWKVTRELNHFPSYKSYDRLVRKIAIHFGTFVKYISRSIP